MIFTINNHFNLNYNTQTKQTYIDKYDKSLKLPFISALNNNLPSIRQVQTDELRPDDSALAVSDTVQLSSAVVGASTVSDSDTGGMNAEDERG